MADNTIHTVPETRETREYLRSLIGTFMSARPLSPPLSLEDLSGLSDSLIGAYRLAADMKGWIMVEIHNRVWQETVASIPYGKRILLLPKCLSHSSGCQAEIDELGLLCRRCHRCTIPDLQDTADQLGMMSIVAEGFTSVITLIKNQVVDAVIGVGCLDSLEKSFPLLIDNAVPGLAVPLNTAGCKDTDVDNEYVNRLLRMQSGREASLLDYDGLKSTLKQWFSPENLDALLTPSDGRQAFCVARECLGGDGKRWRPYLLAATYLALSGQKEIPAEVQQAAIAVECFHKASLIHDDIQDNDTIRYGKQTVNAAYGVPIAINAGDMLLGEGYRLLAGSGNMELVKAIAEAHVALCKGQGTELEWSAAPRTLTMDFVLDIFVNKTVPAFDVSLNMGVICAGNDSSLQSVLRDYSRALGVAYQLQDDLEDFETETPLAMRPSAVLAAICEQATGEGFVQELLRCGDPKIFLSLPAAKPLLDGALDRVRQMAGQYRLAALEALNGVANVELKRLLFRVTKQILK